MLDFKELSEDGNDFELLVREILYNRGLEVYWSGKGADGGKDLLCIETNNSNFRNTSKRWLIQCKHKAHSGNAVGRSDLDNIVDSCAEHGTTGYLLVCSTYPSSGVVKRMEEIQNNNKITTQFWDYRTLEKEILKPHNWGIANMFFPNSMLKSGWMINSVQPCLWYANFQGNVFYIATRIGMNCNFCLPEIEKRIKHINSLKLPKGHFLRVRALHFDDKYTNYTMYLDHLIPRDEYEPEHESYLETTVEEIEKFEIIDGISYRFDIQSYRYNGASDNFDIDHCGYYEPYLKNFEGGTSRQNDRKFVYMNKNFSRETLNTVNGAFDTLMDSIKKIDFISVLRAINSKVEFIDQFTENFSQNSLIANAEYDVDNFFSVNIRFECEKFDMLSQLLTKIPQSALGYFQLSKNYIFMPEEGLEEDENVYTLKISLNPALFSTKVQYRRSLNIYLMEIKTAIEKYLKQKTEQSAAHFISREDEE